MATLLLTLACCHTRNAVPSSPHAAPAALADGLSLEGSAAYDWACVWFAFALAGFVQGVAGFGAGITAMAILPIRLPLRDATPVCAVFLLLAVLVLSLQQRDVLCQPRVRAVLPALVVGASVGVPLGGVLLTAADPRALRVLLGVCMLAFVAERALHDLRSEDGAEDETAEGGEVDSFAAADRVHHLRRDANQDDAESPGAPSPAEDELRLLQGASLLHGRSDEAHAPGSSGPAEAASARTRDRCLGQPERAGCAGCPLVGVGVGVLSGVLGGALNEAGPPVVMYLALERWDKDALKGTLQFYFLLISLFSVTMLTLKGILLPRHLVAAAAGLPAAAAGLGLGVALYRRLDQRLFGRVVVVAFFVAGVSYIAHSAAELLSSRGLK